LKIIEVQSTKRSSQYKGRNVYNLKPLALILDQTAPMVRDKIDMSIFSGREGTISLIMIVLKVRWCHPICIFIMCDCKNFLRHR